MKRLTSWVAYLLKAKRDSPEFEAIKREVMSLPVVRLPGFGRERAASTAVR